MLRAINFCYVTLFIFRYYVNSADFMTSTTYKKMMSSDGTGTCSVNQPTATLTMTASDTIVKCAMQCASSSCCLVYQFKKNTATCELFSYMPTNFTVVSQCTGGFIAPSKCCIQWKLIYNKRFLRVSSQNIICSHSLFIVARDDSASWWITHERPITTRIVF